MGEVPRGTVGPAITSFQLKPMFDEIVSQENSKKPTRTNYFAGLHSYGAVTLDDFKGKVVVLIFVFQIPA
jgi:hypothetical protein